jgi:hypothetical protein
MKVHVEVGVFDPEGSVQVERDFDKSSTVGAKKVESVFDRRPQSILEAPSFEARCIEEAERSDVSELSAGLHQEEAVVETRKLLHG